jgi:hypothetical protein
MTPAEKIERERQAADRRGAQLRRQWQLRKRVLAATLVCFALFWGVVFVQLVSGRDPALSTGPTRAGATSKPTAEPIQPAPAEVEVPVETEAGSEAEAEAQAEAELEVMEAEAEAELAEVEVEPEAVTTGQS